jgi:hypothetical protein
MAKNKQGVNFSVHRDLADRFREATREYYGKLGLCFSAALLMFLEADPEVQGQYIKRVFDAETDDEVKAVIEQAKAVQLKTIKAREDGGKPKRASS